MLDKTVANVLKVARKRLYNDSTDTTLSDTDGILFTNLSLEELVILVLLSSGDWQYKGDYAVADISAGTNEISFGNLTDLLRINRIEIKYPSSALEYRPATQIDHHSVHNRGLDSYATPNPQFDLFDNGFFFFVSDKKADIQAVSEGIKMWFEIDHAELTATSDTISIVFPCVNILGLMVARMQVRAVQDYSLANDISNEINEQKAAIEIYYTDKSTAKRASIRPRREDYGQGRLASGTGSPTAVSHRHP